MVKKIYQNKKGGLNQKGRDYFKRTEGSNLKRPSKSGTSPRRVSFAARFAGMKGPMKKPDGKPTRKALALKAWGFGSVEAARNFANRHKKKKGKTCHGLDIRRKESQGNETTMKAKKETRCYVW